MKTKIFKVKISQLVSLEYVKNHNFSQPITPSVSFNLIPENVQLFTELNILYKPDILFLDNKEQVIMKIKDNLTTKGIVREIYIRDIIRGTKKEIIEIIEKGL